MVKEIDFELVDGITQLLIVVVFHITYTRILRRNIFYVFATSLFAATSNSDDVALVVPVLLIAQLIPDDMTLMRLESIKPVKKQKHLLPL